MSALPAGAGGASAAHAVEGVVVAVPARDEQARLPVALAAIDRAAAGCPVPVVVVVAADACTDRTAAVARRLGAHVVTTTAGRAGAARAAAVRAGLALLALEPAAVWIANTDADSRVPEDWLAVHLAFAGDGVGLLRGSVRPDPHELAPRHLRRWAALHPPQEAHPHVHGANLGLRADVHLAAGGFPDVARDEDVALVRAVLALGHEVRSTDRGPVLTSGRLTGRTGGGFAGYLRRLTADGGAAG